MVGVRSSAEARVTCISQGGTLTTFTTTAKSQSRKSWVQTWSSRHRPGSEPAGEWG